MQLKKNLISSNSGGVLILIAVVFPLLLTVMGITVDVGRLYSVRSKAQNSLDSALMGAVSTLSTINMANETQNLFTANFNGYLGATATRPVVRVNGSGQYSASTTVTVTAAIMQLFGSGTITMNISTSVNAGYQLGTGQKMELALVVDNSGTVPGNVSAIKTASTELVCIIFGAAANSSCSGASSSMSNVFVSTVPYDVDINAPDFSAGNSRNSASSKWIQTGSVAQFTTDRAQPPANTNNFISNRNPDAPPNNTFNDISDAAPTLSAANSVLFRVPVGYGAPSGRGGRGRGGRGRGGNPLNPTNSPDYVATALAHTQFGTNIMANIDNTINAMVNTTGNRRSNVGLMWGWFTLSSNWRGLWNSATPTLPLDGSTLNAKNLVLVVTGDNNVYTGARNQSNDNTTMQQLCQAIQSQGIVVFTVAYGNVGANTRNILQACATSASYYFFASNSNQLKSDFQQIADDIVSSTIRLSQ